MDKYKTKSALNKWFSSIKLNKLPPVIQEKITGFDKYQKKLTFIKALQIFLHGINDEKESLRDMDAALNAKSLQKEMDIESISYSQLSRTLANMDSEILWTIFQQLTAEARTQLPATKCNSLYLIDSSTFSLNKRNYPWATFRKTKSGVKLHLKLCFMDKDHIYPDEFKVTPAVEHDDNHLECFVNKPEATYVFDRGYLDYAHLDKMTEDGYFFVTRIKKNSIVRVAGHFEVSHKSNVISDQMVIPGSQENLTHHYRLITIQDDKGKILRFVTNRFDRSAEEIAEMYKVRWQNRIIF